MDYIDPNTLRPQYGGGSLSTGGFMGDPALAAKYGAPDPSTSVKPYGGSMPTGGFMGGQPGYLPMSGQPQYGINPPSYGGSLPTGGFMGGQSGATGGAPRLMDYNTWNNQQATPYNDPMEGPGYRDYTNNFYTQNLGNPNALPQGFLQSDWGSPYLNMLRSYQATQTDMARNPGSYGESGQIGQDTSLNWLQTAPQAFSGGRGFQQYNESLKHDSDGMYNFMSAAVPVIGGAATGGLFNIGMAGVNAAAPNAQTPVTQALPSRAEVNQFANSGGSGGGGGGGAGAAAGAAGLAAAAGAATGPGLLPGLLGGGLELAGGNEALKAYEEAQRKAEAAGQFQPYNIFSGTGSTTMGPGGLTSQLSPEYQGLRNQYLGNAAAGAGAAGSFDPNQMANQMYGQMQAQAAPGEEEARANAIAQLQGMGQIGLGVGADTGNGPANPLYSSLLKAQADAGRQRQLSAYGQSQDMANQMQQRALGWGGAGLGLDQSQLAQQQLSGYFGGLGSNAALGGARLAQSPIMSQGLTKGGFLGGLGGVLSGPQASMPPWLRSIIGGGGGGAGGIPTLPISPPNAGGMFGMGVDQYGNPTQGGNYSGGDPSQYGDLGGNWDPSTGFPTEYPSSGFDLGQFF